MGKKIRYSWFILYTFLFSASPSIALQWQDLHLKGDIYYDRFTGKPITGFFSGEAGQGAIVNGKYDGAWVWYNGGEIFEVGSYIGGEKNGLWVSFNSKTYLKSPPVGHVRSTDYYKDGVLHGEQIIYTRDGAILLRRVYENGVILSEKKYPYTLPE